MDRSRLVITIAREYGSGGRTVGKQLAERLGIHFYDQDILKVTSEKSAVGVEYFRLADEKAGNNILRRIVGNVRETPAGKPRIEGKVTSRDNLFRFQSEVIRELADTESCVIVGRCADYTLSAAGKEDLIRLYVYADADVCAKRVMERDGISGYKDALDKCSRIDRERREYYRYFTGRNWEDTENFDLMINSTKMEFEQVTDLILDYIRLRGYDV